MRATLLAIVAAFLLPAAAYAQRDSSGQSRYHRYKIHRDATGGYNVLDGVACDAAEANRTVTLWLGSAWVGTKWAIQYDWEAGGAATAVTMTCEESLDGTNYGQKTTASCTSGVCSRYARSETYSVSGADEGVVFKLDTEGAWRVRCVFACAGGNANEALTVQALSFIGR